MLALLEVSLFVAPMFLAPEPPPSRSVRSILVAAAPETETDRPGGRTRDAAEKLARDLAGRLRQGEAFSSVASVCAIAPDASAVLGTFFPHVLAPAMDEFLFSAEVGAVSDPIETAAGFHVLQRIERDAACRQILIGGTGPQEKRIAESLLAKLRAGEDFAAMAAKRSDDPVTKARGGALAIFERGAHDSLLKAAAFELEVGEIGGPIESPLGWHLLQRVPTEAIDPALRDDNLARVRCILVAFGGARGAEPALERENDEATAIARSLVERIRAGEDMAALAREHDDDRGGRERAGDLGWIRRRSPQTADVLERVFLEPKGTVLDPIATPSGWLILRRER
jgi:parvulin-like peptidyl-prolyl isomerase